MRASLQHQLLAGRLARRSPARGTAAKPCEDGPRLGQQALATELSEGSGQERLELSFARAPRLLAPSWKQARALLQETLKPSSPVWAMK
eukprot:1223291-Alexandrium_andersonii.AAC.1